MQNITDQPKLTVKTVPSSRSGDQHWQVLLDPNGIIAPDGQPIALSSKVSNTSSLTVMFDTGFSLNQVPKYGLFSWNEETRSHPGTTRYVADAIYSGFPGAQFTNVTATGPVWTLPCDIEVNTTLFFGNMSYPVHPLDTSLNLTDSSGTQICVGGVCIISGDLRICFMGLFVSVPADHDCRLARLRHDPWYGIL